MFGGGTGIGGGGLGEEEMVCLGLKITAVIDFCWAKQQ